jgi:hypothetical protein
MDCANYNPKQHIHHSHNTRVETYIFWVRITCALKAWSLRWLHPMGSSPHEPKDPSLWRIFIQCMKTIYRIYIYIYITSWLISINPLFYKRKRNKTKRTRMIIYFLLDPTQGWVTIHHLFFYHGCCGGTKWVGRRESY